MAFKGLLLEKSDAGFSAQLKSLNESDLPPGEVLIRVSHSSLNYKDALGIHDRAPVIRKFPMVAGIDVAGVVESSADARWKPGDAALVTGFGLGETRWGGLAELCRVPADFPVRLPTGMSAATAMSIGTAGLTAMFCVNALERAGLRPLTQPSSNPEPTLNPSEEGSRNPDAPSCEVPLLGGVRSGLPPKFTDSDVSVLVTGAAGGVGSMAVYLLSQLGYRVMASTGRVSEAEYLMSLGAVEVLDRAELSTPGKPLQKERWIAAVDTVGSHTLANVCANTRERGWVTTCGMAQGLDFPATVAPFILRGVTLIGIASSSSPMADRLPAWQRLVELIDPAKLALMTRTIRLEEAIAASAELLAGKVRGRLLVAIG
jgi:acrylyl-CoA reductase (NADPH)